MVLAQRQALMIRRPPWQYLAPRYVGLMLTLWLPLQSADGRDILKHGGRIYTFADFAGVSYDEALRHAQRYEPKLTDDERSAMQMICIQPGESFKYHDKELVLPGVIDAAIVGMVDRFVCNAILELHLAETPAAAAAFSRLRLHDLTARNAHLKSEFLTAFLAIDTTQATPAEAYNETDLVQDCYSLAAFKNLYSCQPAMPNLRAFMAAALPPFVAHQPSRWYELQGAQYVLYCLLKYRARVHYEDYMPAYDRRFGQYSSVLFRCCEQDVQDAVRIARALQKRSVGDRARAVSVANRTLAFLGAETTFQLHRPARLMDFERQFKLKSIEIGKPIRLTTPEESGMADYLWVLDSTQEHDRDQLLKDGFFYDIALVEILDTYRARVAEDVVLLIDVPFPSAEQLMRTVMLYRPDTAPGSCEWPDIWQLPGYGAD